MSLRLIIIINTGSREGRNAPPHVGFGYDFRTMSRLGRNDPCDCGSGRKYKKCCQPLDTGRKTRSQLASSSLTLRDKNIALLSAMDEIFGLGRPWNKVKDGMTDAQIREFYSFIAQLWPIDADPQHTMPAPDSTLKALYLGENEPEAMLHNVFRFCLYADQIILVNPFENPNLIAEEFNPLHRPGEWKLQTIRLVYHLMLLTPWIAAGLVVLIPDPGDFNRQLRVETWNLAAKRLEGVELSAEDLDKSTMKQRTRDTFLLAPRSYLERMTREATPGISDEEVRKVLNYLEETRANNPFLPNVTLDRMPAQVMAARMGANLEMGMYICQATGAFPYTNVRFRWKEILGATEKLDATAQVWSPLTNAFQKLTFKFLDNVDSKFACSIRQEGRLEGFRSYMRKLWNTVGGEPDPFKSESLARDFRDELSQAFSQAQSEWEAIDRELLKWAVPTLGGAIASGAFSLALPAAGFAVAGIGEIIQAEMKRREFRRKVPMSVFIDLQRR